MDGKSIRPLQELEQHLVDRTEILFEQSPLRHETLRVTVGSEGKEPLEDSVARPCPAEQVSRKRHCNKKSFVRNPSDWRLGQPSRRARTISVAVDGG
jgi:hypothetical protein